MNVCVLQIPMLKSNPQWDGIWGGAGGRLWEVIRFGWMGSWGGAPMMGLAPL